MSSRTKSGGPEKLYDATADINWNEFEILKLLFICGMSQDHINNATIDEVISNIQNIFAFDERKYIDTDRPGEFMPFPNCAANRLLMREQNRLSFHGRRLWRARHLARFQASL